MTIGASMRPTLNCSRAVLWSWLGARTTKSKEPLRRSAIRSGFFLGLASGHSLWISCVLKPLSPIGYQPRRCSHSPSSCTRRMCSECSTRWMNGCTPELVNQFRDGRFNSRHRFRDPSITLRRCRDDLSGLAGQCLSVGGQILLLVVQILILRSVVNHRPEYDSSPADLSGLLRPADPPGKPRQAHTRWRPPGTHPNLLRPEKSGQLIWDLLACGRRMASNPCAGRDRGHRVSHYKRSCVGVGVAAAG